MGKPWSLANFPPKNPQELGHWIQTEGAWEKILPRLQSVLKWCQQQGIEHIGYLGFCWGGKMAALTSIHLAQQIKAVALVHPYMVDANDATLAQRPWCLLPSKDEPDMVRPYAITFLGKNNGNNRLALDSFIYPYSVCPNNFNLH